MCEQDAYLSEAVIGGSGNGCKLGQTFPAPETPDASHIDQSVELAGVRLKNPVVAASGTFGFGREYGEFFGLSELGGICCKGLTLSPREGNPPPRIAETPLGMLNSVGLQNPGVDAFIRDELPFLRQHRQHLRQYSGGVRRDVREAVRSRS